MRRLMFLVVATGLLAAITVALASATTAKVATKTATPTEATPSYLPAGMAPCGTDWPAAGCDGANTAYSTMTQLNTSNVSGLKLVWHDWFYPTGVSSSVECQPIEVNGANNNLPDSAGTVYQTVYQGVVAV